MKKSGKLGMAIVAMIVIGVFAYTLWSGGFLGQTWVKSSEGYIKCLGGSKWDAFEISFNGVIVPDVSHGVGFDEGFGTILNCPNNPYTGSDIDSWSELRAVVFNYYSISGLPPLFVVDYDTDNIWTTECPDLEDSAYYTLNKNLVIQWTAPPGGQSWSEWECTGSGGDEKTFKSPVSGHYFIYTTQGEICGDGSINLGEECDDSNTFSGDGCSSTCEIEDGWNCNGEPSVCEEDCGDGLIVGGEECDGSNLGGYSCIDLGYYGGSLACTSQCVYDTSGCTGETQPGTDMTIVLIILAIVVALAGGLAFLIKKGGK